MSEPQTLPTSWIHTTLGEVAEINPSTTNNGLLDDTFVSFIPMAAVEAGTGKLNISHQKQVKDVKKGFTSFVEGDVLFAKITPCMENGKICIARSLISGKGYGSTEFHVIRPEPNISSDYVYHFVSQKNYRNSARSHMTGTAGQLRVPTQYILNTMLPLSPLAEQRRIVAAIEQQFTRLDAGIASLRQAQTRLNRYRAAVLKAAVEGHLTAAWRAEHPDTEPAETLLACILTERRTRWEDEQRAKGKDPAKPTYAEPARPDTATLPALPEGWTWATFSQLGNLDRGKSKHRPRNDSRLFGGIYPFIQTGDVRSAGDTLTSFTNTYSDFGLAQSWLWPKGTLCITIAANIAETSILNFEACFPDSVVGFADPTGILNIKFINYGIRAMKNDIERAAPATAQKNINLEILGKLVFPFPPLAEQEQIVAEVERRLSVVSEVEAKVLANLKRAERLRQSILREAFAGRLVEQDSADEPASILLERIRDERATRDNNGSRSRRKADTAAQPTTARPDTKVERMPLDARQMTLLTE